MWLVNRKDRGVALFKRDGKCSMLYQGAVYGVERVAVCDAICPLLRSARTFCFPFR